jgi:hypothetical protein
MQHDPRKIRRKLFASLAVLTVVFTVAAIAQFTGTLPNVSAVNKAADKPTQVNPNQPRAVFGEVPPAALVVPAPSVQPSEPTEETARSRAEVATSPGRGQIEGLLDRWRKTFARGDINGQTILYAPKMEAFYERNGVSRETVRREKSRMMELYPRVHRYEISDVKFESHKHDEAVVSFRKDWDMNGDRRFTGADRQRLKLRRINGDWKIVSEEEMQIYWVKRG